MYLADRQWNPFLRLFPRENTHLRLWRQHRGFHGDRVRVRRDIVGEDQDGCLAMPYEIASYGEDKIRVGAVHLGEKFIDRLRRDFGTALY